MKAPLIAICRHRLATDGQGVTTLVAFHGCPLSCRYCLNPQCTAADGVWQRMDAEEILQAVAVDDLYFQATGGGVTFGGGEPLLHSDTIVDFCQRRPPQWNITVETSLNVPTDQLAKVAPYVGHYLVDVKDMAPDIYRRYTLRDNCQVAVNLQWLADHVGPQHVTVRLPRIPGYNTPADIAASRRRLEALGYGHFNVFDYIVPETEKKAAGNLKQLLGLRRRFGRAVIIVAAAGLLGTPACGQNRKATKSVAAKKAVKPTRAEEDVVIGGTGGVPRNTGTKARAFTIPYRTGHNNDENMVYDVVSEMPCFPGSSAALIKFMKSEMKYPEVAKKKHVQGRVIVTFVVEKDGRITNAKVVKSIGPLLDAEALRIIRKMPRWHPGRQDGIAVRVKYTLPVTFRLP